MAQQNEHARIIANTVFHTFPYNALVPNFKGPHSDDCGGCIINIEVEKLVKKLDKLSPVEQIVADLEAANETVKTLSEDKSRAFKIAGVDEEGSVADLVTFLVEEKDRLTRILTLVSDDLTATKNRINIGNRE